MSKIGQKTIEVPQTVTVDIQKDMLTVKGPVGQVEVTIPAVIEVIKEGNVINVKRKNEEKKSKSLHGLVRQLIYNAVVGTEKPWEKRMEVVGTGYNVKLQGEDLVFKLGYSHPSVFKKVAGLTYKVEGNNKVVVSGANKQFVGEIAYLIKMLKKPDVYKGKGIKYEGEVLRIKPGKKAKVATGAPA